ncbi:MAG: hypothetical protein GXO66_08045 [Euryarchaeota archaeon]|nr:hypothetical protein [Euryarchaeota archaeon]
MRDEALLVLFLLFSGSAALLYQHELLATGAAPEPETEGGESLGYALALPLLFILALNLYLILFRSGAFLKVLRLVILASAYFSYLLVLLLALALLEALFPQLGFLFLLVLLTGALLPLLAPERLKPWLRNLQLASFAGVAGAALAEYLSLPGLVLALALLAVLDYHYVVRRKVIPELASKLEDAGVPMGVEVGSGEHRLLLGLGDLLFAACTAAVSYAELGLALGVAAVLSVAAVFLTFLHLAAGGTEKAYPALPAVFLAALLVWLMAEVYGVIGGV